MGTLERLLRWVGLDFDLDLRSERFSAITPRLYLGPRPVPEDLELLRDVGITNVVSCLPENRRETVTFLEANFHARFVPIRDGIHEDITPVFDAFFEALATARGPLLVHCEVGVSRSATLAIAAVMRAEATRFYEAYCQVRERRPQVLPNIGFATQLQRFEDSLLPPRRPDELASLTRYLHDVCNVPVEPSVLQAALEDHDFDAVAAIRAIFGGDIPRVVQGVRNR